jgi:hypothetical protein
MSNLHPIGTQLNPMTQLAADQQLTLRAFQAAVDTYNQRQMALPEAIPPILPHLDQLDSLSETDSTFEMLYQAARSALQNGSDRTRFLDTSSLSYANGTPVNTPAVAINASIREILDDPEEDIYTLEDGYPIDDEA